LSTFFFDSKTSRALTAVLPRPSGHLRVRNPARAVIWLPTISGETA